MKIGHLKYFLLCFFVTQCFAQTSSDYRKFLIKYEGCIYSPIYNTNEIKVGIGHNLINSTEAIKQYYRPREIDMFFMQDLEVSIKAARKNIYHFDFLPMNAKLVIISIIFTTGPAGFAKFSHFNLAISKRDYRLAAMELRNSKWFAQVGKRRAEEHFEMLNKITK